MDCEMEMKKANFREIATGNIQSDRYNLAIYRSHLMIATGRRGIKKYLRSYFHNKCVPVERYRIYKSEPHQYLMYIMILYTKPHAYTHIYI